MPEDIKYRSAQEALSDLANLSRMLEIARGCHAQAETMATDLDRLVGKLVADRAAALRAIDALTETAPAAAGFEISPFVEQAGASMRHEVSELERMAAAIVEQCGGLQ